MRVEEIKDIIKACREYGVTSLKFGDLQVEFAKDPEPAQVLTGESRIPEIVLPPSSVDAITAQQKAAERKGFLEDELVFKRDRLDQMLIENPEEAEKLITEGDLEDDGSDDDGDEA